jgi:hypothetical protein
LRARRNRNKWSYCCPAECDVEVEMTLLCLELGRSRIVLVRQPNCGPAAALENSYRDISFAPHLLAGRRPPSHHGHTFRDLVRRQMRGRRPMILRRELGWEMDGAQVGIATLTAHSRSRPGESPCAITHLGASRRRQSRSDQKLPVPNRTTVTPMCGMRLPSRGRIRIIGSSFCAALEPDSVIENPRGTQNKPPP